MSEWFGIDSAPKDGTWVLLYHKYARIGDWYWSGTEWTNDTLVWSEDGSKTDPTHWKPIDPPTD